MKIGILTWSKVNNHGALLQTYATQQILKELNKTSVILDYQFCEDDKDKKFSERIRRLKNRLIPNNIKTRFQISQWNNQKQKKFDNFRSLYCNFGSRYDKESELNKVLIGSDMVFDFYQGYNPFMYGKDVNCDYIFSYAASFGYTTDDVFQNYKNRNEIVKYIKLLKGVSYRDDNTGMLLEKYCQINNAVKCIDPVLLYGFKKEKLDWNQNNWCSRRYLLIYSYTYNMENSSEVRIIKQFAEENNLETISLGYIHPWCNQSINADPVEFIEIFQNATFVITDTFHGTVFSLIFNKQFVVLTRNNSFKILDILKDIDLLELSSCSLSECLSKISKNPIDYIKVNNKVQILRNKSLSYLQKHLQV